MSFVLNDIEFMIIHIHFNDFTIIYYIIYLFTKLNLDFMIIISIVKHENINKANSN